MKRVLFPSLISVAVFVVVSCLLLAPARCSHDLHILPGNGWTHDSEAPLQWTNSGNFGPGSNWNRTEYGLRGAWLVRDEAVGGARVFARVDVFYSLVYLAAAGVSAIIAFGVARRAAQAHSHSLKIR